LKLGIVERGREREERQRRKAGHSSCSARATPARLGPWR
jgi:hypothetical protein